MRRSGRSTIAVLGASALLCAFTTPPALASGGPGSPNGDQCTPTVGGTVGGTTPVPVAETAQISCPLASGPTGVPTGPSGPVNGPFTPGQNCSYVIYQPVKIEVTRGGGVTELDPNATGTQYTGIGYPTDLAPVPVTEQEGNNIYMPWLFKGQADGNGNCTVNLKSQLGCPNPQPFTNFVVAGNVCWFTTPNAAIGGGINPGQLTGFLDANAILQLIKVGTISSLPDNPNAGLVGLGTCFFVNGAAFQGLGGAPQPIGQPAFFTMSISAPVNDGTGRFIFYVFRIRLAFAGADWDFGDGTTVTDPLPPPECQGVPADIAASHTYLKYGTFQVTVTERYDVTIQEFWEDANGQNGPIDLTGVVPPIARVLGPYPKQVIQEEGVPVGGT